MMLSDCKVVREWINREGGREGGRAAGSRVHFMARRDGERMRLERQKDKTTKRQTRKKRTNI